MIFRIRKLFSFLLKITLALNLFAGFDTKTFAQNATGNSQGAIGNGAFAVGSWQFVPDGKPGLAGNRKSAISNHRYAIKNRFWLVAGAHAALWTGSYIALNKAWYAGYPKSSFHFFNDNGEWNQMDKAGHAWTAYQISRLSTGLWKWSGVNDKTGAWLGGLSGLAYQSIIEIQDGFSSEWGFSWGDMTANALGAASFVVQQLAWKDQRIQIKLSYWPYEYTSPELVARRNQLFGKTLAEKILKDYNSQTYWVSANVHAFFAGSAWPAWLNMAAGYSSDGMLGGYANTWTDKQGNTFNRFDIPRVRRFFLSPDIDLTRIKTKNKLLKTVFSIANMVKIPAPAIELNSKGKFKVHALYY